MADEADIVKATEDMILAHNIAVTRAKAARAGAAQDEKDEPGNSWGDCVDCHEPIPAARLQANPRARRCIDCQEDHEEMNG